MPEAAGSQPTPDSPRQLPGRAGRVIAESARIARTQWATTAAVALLVAVQCIVSLFSSGRAAQAEHDVLAVIDQRGTRTITVTAPFDAPLRAELITVISAAPAAAEVLGLGPVSDSRNTAVPGGPPVPLRTGYGTLGTLALVDSTQDVRDTQDTQVWLTGHAARAYGLLDGSGSVTSLSTGTEHVALPLLSTAAHLERFEPLAILPSSSDVSMAGDDPEAPLTQILVLAADSADVAALEAFVRAVLRDAATQRVTVETSSELAQLRAVVSGELGEYGRRTVLAVLGSGLVVIALSLLALTHLRRREFGRRRALGANRGQIMALVIGHTGLAAGAGTVLGTLVVITWNLATGQPPPPPDFALAVAILALLCAITAALLPAVIAARRDPIKELRVP